jgi:asparagine synthase (glutamine-hydrolysing)
MLDALMLSTETERDTLVGRSAALGVARRWTFQNVASVPGIKVAADADLIDVTLLRRAILLPCAASISIAETIAYAYAQRGAEFFSLLRGAFSLALWDEKEQKLIFAIDRLGLRSLFWRREGARLLFASRIGAIRAAQAAPISVNRRALLNYLLFAAVPAPLAIDEGTEKLRPGTFLTFKSGLVQEKQYWDLEYPEDDSKNESQWAAAIREGMRAAVHRQLQDREASQTGCFLSGGTDSSSVVPRSPFRSLLKRLPSAKLSLPAQPPAILGPSITKKFSRRSMPSML